MSQVWVLSVSKWTAKEVTSFVIFALLRSSGRWLVKLLCHRHIVHRLGFQVHMKPQDSQ
jgi:hypothetical protein